MRKFKNIFEIWKRISMSKGEKKKIFSLYTMKKLEISGFLKEEYILFTEFLRKVL